MKPLLLISVLAGLSLIPMGRAAHYGHHGPALLPDAEATPGAVRTTDAKQVCSTTTPQYRHTTRTMKLRVCAEYRQIHCPGPGFELDHLIPLELGGLDGTLNLWPQPAAEPGYHQKDLLENYLHKEVCAGRTNLADAQKAIATDWYAAYLEMIRGRS